jgi:hypothetical protein
MLSQKTSVWSEVAFDRTNNRKQNGVAPVSLSYSRVRSEKQVDDFARQNSWVNKDQVINKLAERRLKKAKAEFNKLDAMAEKRAEKHAYQGRFIGRRERVGFLVIGKI